MKALGVVLALIGVAACDTGAPAAKAPQQQPPAETGVKISGYGRVGVSGTF
ncbi:hypothetical protein K3720_03580 [Leisingera caerulea]|uniref:hypothetical protein n=1 Tax=Leisingera caerulea TaxID=506591 RepID=UPI0021A5F319|nr:hypothetical protein [Leisingera caerulea]UWQ50503.1 hypothetical protein K3720_03580 [Leisingera caerulea]